GDLSSLQILMSWSASATIYSELYFTTGNVLRFDSTSAGGTTVTAACPTSAVFRDPAAWYHVVFSMDTTQSTTANRVKLYVNGVQQTVACTTSPSESQAMQYGGGSGSPAEVGADTIASGGAYFDGDMSDVYFIDGAAL